MKQTFRYILFVLVASLWATLCFILPEFLEDPVNGFRGVLTIGLYVAILGGVQFLLLYAFLLNKYVAAVVLPIYSLLGAATAFYRYAYHATVTPLMVDVMFHTTKGSVASVMSWQLFVFVGLNLLVAVLFVLYRWKRLTLNAQWIHLLVSVAAFLLYYSFSSHLQKRINQSYPMNVVVSMKEYLSMNREAVQRTDVKIDEVSAVEDIDIVVVLGESARADHVSLNGYSVNTCPRLGERHNLYSLPDIYSQYANTLSSVPHLLTMADSINPSLSASTRSFISVFSDLGYATSWISNQDYGHTYTDFIHEADTAIFPNADKSVYVYHPWYDEDLLPPVDSLMANTDKRKNLYVLHTIGSHWYYNYHVTPSLQQFTPMTDSRIVTQNTEQQMLNSYDNTILYLDYFLDTLISRFDERTAVVIYLSDHGESLGENGKWLHAGDGEAMHRPAALVWYSDSYAALFPEKAEALKQNSRKRYRTDYLFYSVLSAAGISADGNNPQVDIFSHQ